jgi:hypothetical protein
MESSHKSFLPLNPSKLPFLERPAPVLPPEAANLPKAEPGISEVIAADGKPGASGMQN